MHSYVTSVVGLVCLEDEFKEGQKYHIDAQLLSTVMALCFWTKVCANSADPDQTAPRGAV